MSCAPSATWRGGPSRSESRWAGGRQDRLPTLAAELVALPVDILVTTGGAPVVRAAKQATTGIPIVAMIMNSPVETGLVSSLARPGGNVTGHAFDATALSTKQLELLKETVPQLSRVAVLWYEGGNHEAGTVRAAQDAAKILRIQLQAHEVREPADIGSAVSALKGGCTGTSPDPVPVLRPPASNPRGTPQHASDPGDVRVATVGHPGMPYHLRTKLRGDGA